MTSQMSFCSHSSTTWRTSSAEYIAPLGLFGLLRTMAFV